jgi:hypothetical protein
MEDNTKDEVKECCLNIFLNFAKLKKNEFILPYLELNKIMKLANLKIKQNEIDLILKSVTSNLNLNSEQFMNFLVLLCQRLKKEEFKANNKKCVVEFIKTNFYPVYNYIQESDNNYPTKDIQNAILETQFDDNLIFLLRQVSSGLIEIYKQYFYYENSDNFYPEIKNLSFDELILFAKDFKIIPYITSSEKVGIIYHMLSEMKQEDITKNGLIFEQDLGIFFKLNKFVAVIVHLALISHERFDKYLEYKQHDISINPLDNASKLILFLFKLQSSKGFMTKNLKPFTNKMLITPSKEIIEKVNFLILDQPLALENFIQGENSNRKFIRF